MRSGQRASTDTLKLTILVFMAAVLLAPVSCALRPRPAGEPEGAPHEPSAGKPCPAGSIALVNRKLNAAKSIEATLNMTVSMKSPPFSARVQAGLVADKQSRFRLRAFTGPISVLDVAVSRDSVWAYLPGNSVMFVGTVREAMHSAPDSGVAYVLAVASLRELFFPSPFAPESCRTERLDRKTCRLEERVPGTFWEEAADVDPAAGSRTHEAGWGAYPEVRDRVASVELRSGRIRALSLLNGEGANQVSVSYSDYRKTGKGTFPHGMAVEFPNLGIALNLAFDRVQVNTAIAETSFKVAVPEDVKVVRFNELGY